MSDGLTQRLRGRAARLCVVLAGSALAPVGGVAVPAIAAPVARPALAISFASAGPAVLTKTPSKRWTPASLAAAYGVTWSPWLGAGRTIAIVDPFDAPTAEAHLATFSQNYGLPQCTSATGCFEKVNQTGGTNLPTPNSSWQTEVDLDVQWVHAMAPAARILLVESANAVVTNLAAANAYANFSSDATYITNSWGVPEYPGEISLDSSFTPVQGKSIFVASGDAGLPAMYPSSSPNVISVGGTRLKGGRSVDEEVWGCVLPSKPKPCTGGNGSGGGGCSLFEAAPPAQAQFAEYAHAGCNGKRATPDLAAVADPDTGVAVFTAIGGKTGWVDAGGTSAASPIVTAIAAASGITMNPAKVYGPSLKWRDIKMKSASAKTNGATCLVGFDLCAGRGAWINALG